MEGYTLTAVRENGNAVRVELLAPDGEVKRHRMTVKLWESFHLTRGDVLSCDEYMKVADISERCEAVTRGMKLLAQSSYSCKKLTEKLRRAGFSSSAAEDAVAIALRRGLIDEASQARDYALKYVEIKHRGRGRVISSLISHGYSPDTARRAADGVPREVYAEALEAQLAKHCPGELPEDRRERDKLCAALVRQGFGVGEVLAAMGAHFCD